MLRVALLISHAGCQGGLQKYARETAKALATAGCEVTILTLGSALQMSDSRIRVLSLGQPAPLSLLTLWRYDRACQLFLRDHPVDIVFGFDRTRKQTHLRAGNGVHAAYLCQRRLIESSTKTWSFALNPLHRSLLHFERVAFESPDLQRLFTNSWMVRDEILRTYKTHPEKIEV